MLFDNVKVFGHIFVKDHYWYLSSGVQYTRHAFLRSFVWLLFIQCKWHDFSGFSFLIARTIIGGFSRKNHADDTSIYAYMVTDEVDLANGSMNGNIAGRRRTASASITPLDRSLLPEGNGETHIMMRWMSSLNINTQRPDRWSYYYSFMEMSR